MLLLVDTTCGSWVGLVWRGPHSVHCVNKGVVWLVMYALVSLPRGSVRRPGCCHAGTAKNEYFSTGWFGSKSLDRDPGLAVTVEPLPSTSPVCVCVCSVPVVGALLVRGELYGGTMK